MLLKENSCRLENIFNILDNSTYINLKEIVSSSTIPILENRRLNTWIVDYHYIDELKEAYGYSFDECINILKEENDLDDITVSIDDADILENCSIVDGIDNYVIRPCKRYFSTLLEEVLLEIKIDPNEIDAEFYEINSGNKRIESPPKMSPPKIIDTEFKEIEIDKDDISELNSDKSHINGLKERLDEINRKFDEELKEKMNDLNNSEIAKETKRKWEELNRKIAGVKQGGGSSGNSYGGSSSYSYRGGRGSSSSRTYKVATTKINKDKGWGYKADKWCRDKIEKLQSIYKSFLERAKKEKDQNKAGFFKKIAYYILLYIDRFLNFIKDGLFDLKED